MGSIYPHFEGTRWDRLGYDSYDLDASIKPVFMDLFKWTVRQGRKHITVCAKDIDGAKRAACERREDFAYDQITEVRAIQGKHYGTA